MLCDGCAPAEAGTIVLSADALAGLSLLLSRPVAEAGEYLELPRAGEIQKVVEAFLRHHFQRFDRLRSLEANPVIVQPRGKGAVAVDLLVSLAPASAAPGHRLRGNLRQDLPLTAAGAVRA